MERSRVTAPHEIGHGMFGLFHPDDSGGMRFDGLQDSIGRKDDVHNFMLSGFAAKRVSDPKNVRVRKYQYTEIHERI